MSSFTWVHCTLNNIGVMVGMKNGRMILEAEFF